MADTDDQNTPNADFSQSIDGAGESDAVAPVDAEQASEMRGENKESAPLAASAAKAATKPAAKKFDESTLIGRLESKLAAISEVLWEKEGMQMRYTFGNDIREEYYRRWKTEGNSFLILASRLKRRLDKERANARKGSA